MLKRLLLGLIKGVIVGGAIGAVLHFALGVTAIGVGLGYLLYGVTATLAGVVAGQPPWRQGAWIASVLKGLFGFGVGVGVYALVTHFLRIPVGGLLQIPPQTMIAQAPLLFAPAVATVYATLVELDDGGEQAKDDKTGVRAAPGGAVKSKASVDDVFAAVDREIERQAKKK